MIIYELIDPQTEQVIDQQETRADAESLRLILEDTVGKPLMISERPLFDDLEHWRT